MNISDAFLGSHYYMSEGARVTKVMNVASQN